MKLWIDHPAVSNPVGIRRWLAWKIAEFLNDIERRLYNFALYPDRDDDIPF